MNQKKISPINPRLLLSLWTVMLLLLSACSSSVQTPPAPFSQVFWDSTPEELEMLEGTAAETTASIYGGTTYLFPCSYLNYQGTVKYMYDDAGQLAAIAFYHEGSTADEIAQCSREIYQLTAKTYGDGIHSETAGHNSGEKWMRPEGNIILSVLATADANALQYAFLHPSVSEQE